MDKREKKFIWAINTLEKAPISEVYFPRPGSDKIPSFSYNPNKTVIIQLGQFLSKSFFEEVGYSKKLFSIPFIDEEAKDPYGDVYYALTLWNKTFPQDSAILVDDFLDLNDCKQYLVKGLYGLLYQRESQNREDHLSVMREMGTNSPKKKLESRTIRLPFFLRSAGKYNRNSPSREEGPSSFL